MMSFPVAHSLTWVQSYCIETRGTFSLWMMGDRNQKSHASFSGELLRCNSLWGWGWVMLHSALVWDVQARNVHVRRTAALWAMLVCSHRNCEEQQLKGWRRRWGVKQTRAPSFSATLALWKVWLLRLESSSRACINYASAAVTQRQLSSPDNCITRSMCRSMLAACA